MVPISTRRRGYNLLWWVLCLMLLISGSDCLLVPPLRGRTRQQTAHPGVALFVSNRFDSEETNNNSLGSEEAGGVGPPMVEEKEQSTTTGATSTAPAFWNDLKKQMEAAGGAGAGNAFRIPPIQIDDPNLLFYDIFLLINLVVSISFWVVHRMQLEYIALAFNEGCLLSILWVCAGLYHGAFLYSAVDGHQRPTSTASTMDDQANKDDTTATNVPWWEILNKSNNKGGPPAAGLLALNTFINTISLRLIVALVVAVAEHRPVFDDPLEQLIPLEVGFGLILMSCWRTIHSAFTPRI